MQLEIPNLPLQFKVKNCTGIFARDPDWLNILQCYLLTCDLPDTRHYLWLGNAYIFLPFVFTANLSSSPFPVDKALEKAPRLLKLSGILP